MSPRTSACRSAVQHIRLRQAQPVWITDDVLADAFHRFLNVSNATRKRYGSNVPGPLEARRRASKRRLMGLAAAGQGSGPDWGALFGLDKPADQSWRWEAPKRTEHPLVPADGPSSQLPQWLSNFEDASNAEHHRAVDPLIEYSKRLGFVHDVEELNTLWSEVEVEPQHTALFSQMAYTHFMDKVLSNETMAYWNLFDFFRNPRLNVPEAQNIKAFVQHAAGNAIPEWCLAELINRIRDSLRLGTMLQPELAGILDRMEDVCMLALTNAEAANNWLFGAYWAMWRGISSCKVWPVEKVDSSIIRRMAERILALPDPPPISDIKKLKELNLSSHTDPALFRLELYLHVWPTITGTREPKVSTVLALWARQLGRLDVEDFSMSPNGLSWEVVKSVLDSLPVARAQAAMAKTTKLILDGKSDTSMDNETKETLRLWFNCVSRTRYMDPSASTKVDIFSEDPSLARLIDPGVAVPLFQQIPLPHFCQIWMWHWIPQYVAQDGVSAVAWKKVRRDVPVLFNESMRRNAHVEESLSAPFLYVLKALRDKEMPYRTTLSKAVEVILAMHGPATVHQFYGKVMRNGFWVEDPLPFAAAVEAMCDTHPMHALTMFKRIPNMWLSLCPKLPLALINHGSLPRDELFALLDRKDPANRIANLDRAAVAGRSQALRNDLIHIIAYTYANQLSRPTRQRFRNVYFCYLYLRDHGAPLQPLLAKAFVRAAITAPLENKEWVSTVKLGWVLRFVRDLEGPDVADRLDRLAWAWRGQVIREARARWDAAGLYPAQGPSTVTAARRAGLFEHDFPIQPGGRRVYRKKLVRAGFLAPKRLRRVRWGGSGKAWGRLPRKEGGRDGAKRLVEGEDLAW